MENKKEPGMIWYSYLRFFAFGLFRISSFNGIMAALATLNESITILAIISLIFAISDFVFRIVIHRHLENYSTNVFKSLLLFYIIRTIYWILYFLTYYDALVAFFTSILLNGSLCLINYKYFKKRSHIFTNECNFFGGIKNISTLKQENIINVDSIKASVKTYQLIYDDETILYAKHLIEHSSDLLSEKDAYDFMRIIQIYTKFGKENAIEEFDVLANEIINKERNIFKTSFFVGALYANKIITNDEKEEMNKKHLVKLEKILLSTNNIKNNFCRKCGEKLNEGSKFCHKCGAEVAKLEELNK